VPNNQRSAIILAAGRGERMRPLTDHTPKPLLSIGNKRLIEFTLDKLAQAHCHHVVINCAHLADQFEHYLGNGSRYGLNILYSFEEQALETAGGIHQALPLINSSEFVVINGDIWCDYPITKLFEHKLGNNLAHLVMVDNPSQHPHGDFLLNQQKICSKQQETNTGLTYSGLGKFSLAMFADLAPGKMALRPLLDKAIEKQRLSGEYYRGDWRDIGTPARLEQLRQDQQNAH